MAVNQEIKAKLEDYQVQLAMVTKALPFKPKWIIRKNFLEAEIARLSGLVNG